MADVFEKGTGERGEYFTLTRAQNSSYGDFWNVYRYGDRYKVVYVKKGQPRKKPGRKITPEQATKEGIGVIAGKLDYYAQNPTAIFDEPTDEGGRFDQSVNRAKARIFELALCNEFTFFCTFTQNAALRDRFDLGAFRKQFAQFVRNLNRSRSEADKIRYLLVPEQHLDGAWHMHGLLMGLKSGELVKNSNNYWDWVGYREKFGFFSVSRIKNREKTAAYMSKYITKSLTQTAIERGGHLFFASQGLKGRDCLGRGILDPCPVDGWDYENEWVKVKWLSDFSDIES